MTKKTVFLQFMEKSVLFIALNLFSVITISASENTFNGHAEENFFSCNMESTTVENVLNYIEKNSNYIFIYSKDVHDNILQKKISISVKNKKIKDIIENLSVKAGFDYTISGHQVTLVKSKSKEEVKEKERQVVEKQVSGRIVDKNTNDPIIGATVMEAGTSNGTVSNVDGYFNLKTGNNPVLQISYIGYKKLTVRVGNSNNITVNMLADDETLNEVVVVGYGSQKKVDLTGSVAAVDMSKIIESRPVTNVSNGLAGLVPGLYVRSTDNTPGNDASLLLRGLGTLNNSAPLIIIDGVEGSFNSVTPQDVATISVLKDAASSAIYGSRAANGVILITTKKGGNGKVKLNYDGYVSGESVAHKMHFVSSNADYMELQNELLTNSGSAKMFSDENIKAWREHDGENSLEWPSTDWANAVFRTSWITNHNISVSGGTNAIQTFISFNFQDTPGILENTGFKKYALRANNELKVTDWFKVGLNLNGVYMKRQPGSNQVDGFFRYTSNCVPSIVVRGPEGKWGGTNNSEENQGGCLSPLSYLYKYTGNNNSYILNSKFYATLTPMKGLVINASYHYKWNDQKTKEIPHDLEGWNFQTNQLSINWADSPRVEDYDVRSIRNFMDADASYDNKLFDGQLYFKVMLGASQEQFKTEYMDARRTGLIDENLDQLDACTGGAEAYGNVSRNWAMRSFFGRVNLSWSEKYLFEFNYRRDGSSRFSSGNRWGNFPSLSAGWRISEEPFMASLRKSWLTNLKLRASWGSLGNNAVGDFATISTMSDALYVLNGKPVNGFVNSGIANANLKWESTYVTNLGLDFTLMDKLNGSVDVYNKQTKNILAQLPIPVEVGLVDPPVQNSAKVRNRGVEVNLDWHDNIEDVNYFVNGNFTYNNNKVIKFKDGERTINGTTMIQEGYGINTLFVRKVDRIIQNDNDLAVVNNIIKNASEKNLDNPFPNGTPVKGDLLYSDVNKDGIINDDDRVPIGNGSAPHYMFAFGFGVNWKGFDFSCQMDGVAGIKSYFNNDFYTVSIGQPQVINKEIADGRWYEGRTSNAKFPRLTSASVLRNTLYSDFWVKNASYLKIRNIQLGYTIPEVLIHKAGISRLRVYCSLENYFTITSYPGLDPEVSGMNYPSMKQVVFGINLSI